MHTPVPCVADIAESLGASFWGDGTVNVNDLLAVINNWGDCDAMVNGEVDGVAADCMEYATETLELEPYSESWKESVNDCLNSL